MVLALGPKALYLLGRHKVGPLASFADLTVIAQLPRDEVQAHLAQAGIVKDLTIVDTKTGEEYVYEVKPLGSGVNALLDDLDKDA